LTSTQRAKRTAMSRAPIDDGQPPVGDTGPPAEVAAVETTLAAAGQKLAAMIGRVSGPGAACVQRFVADGCRSGEVVERLVRPAEVAVGLLRIHPVAYQICIRSWSGGGRHAVAGVVGSDPSGH
jgi:hypothetical protein